MYLGLRLGYDPCALATGVRLALGLDHHGQEGVEGNDAVLCAGSVAGSSSSVGGLLLQAVCIVFAAVRSSTLAVIACLPAIRGIPTSVRHRAIVSCRRPVSGSTFAVHGRAPRDVFTRMINNRAIERHQLVIAFDAHLVTVGGRPIAAKRTRIATSGSTGTPHCGSAALARVTVACVGHKGMQATIATRRWVAIA